MILVTIAASSSCSAPDPRVRRHGSGSPGGCRGQDPGTRSGMRASHSDRLPRSKVSYLVHCPWCLSFYFGAALTLGRHLAPGPTQGVARTFALSALAGIGTQLLGD